MLLLTPLDIRNVGERKPIVSIAELEVVLRLGSYSMTLHVRMPWDLRRRHCKVVRLPGAIQHGELSPSDSNNYKL